MNISYPPSFNFANLNTAIIAIKDCAQKYPGYHLWIKRDDLTGLELSGNKVRKLDFLLKDVVNNGATHIITCGAVQSNHCRATAFMAAKIGLNCTLFLRGQPEGFPTGNFFLDKLVNPEIIFVTVEEYREIESRMEQEAQKLSGRGEKVYVIPEGGSNVLGVWGYIRCMEEISNQIQKASLPIQAIMVATGSGGTHAGLLLGKLIMNSNLDVLSVNVCDDAAFFKQKILKLVNEFKNRFNYQFKADEGDINIFDGFVGEGYGKITSQEIDMIKRFALSEGIILDPVYCAKAFLGLEYLLKNRALNYENILFIHTGGIFGIFPYANDFI